MAFAACQERHSIEIPLLGKVDPALAFDCAHDTDYFNDLILSNHDPLWAYRYIQYRLNGVYREKLKGLGKFNYLVCTSYVIGWLRDNIPDDDEKEFLVK